MSLHTCRVRSRCQNWLLLSEQTLACGQPVLQVYQVNKANQHKVLRRLWKQWNICWHFFIQHHTFPVWPLNFFFLSNWDRIIRILKMALLVKGMVHLTYERRMIFKVTTNLRAVSSPFLSSVLLLSPESPKIIYGMLEGTSFHAAWRISYTTCSRILLPIMHLIFSSSSTISREYLFSYCGLHEDRANSSVISFEISLDALDALFNWSFSQACHGL